MKQEREEIIRALAEGTIAETKETKEQRKTDRERILPINWYIRLTLYSLINFPFENGGATYGGARTAKPSRFKPPHKLQVKLEESQIRHYYIKGFTQSISGKSHGQQSLFTKAIRGVIYWPGEFLKDTMNKKNLEYFNAGVKASQGIPTREDCLKQLIGAKETGAEKNGENKNVAHLLGLLFMYDNGFELNEKKLAEQCLKDYNLLYTIDAKEIPKIFLEDYKKGFLTELNEYIKELDLEGGRFQNQNEEYLELFLKTDNKNNKYYPNKNLEYLVSKFSDQILFSEERSPINEFIKQIKGEPYVFFRNFLVAYTQMRIITAETEYNNKKHPSNNSIEKIEDPAAVKILAIKQFAALLLNINDPDFATQALADLRENFMKITYCDLQITPLTCGKEETWKIIEDIYQNGFSNILTAPEQKYLLGPEYASANTRLHTYLVKHKMEEFLKRETADISSQPVDLLLLVEHRVPYCQNPPELSHSSPRNNRLPAGNETVENNQSTPIIKRGHN